MKRFLVGLALSAAAVSATPAAAVTISSIGAANNYPTLASVQAMYAPGATTYTFEGGTAPATLTGGSVVSGASNPSGIYAIPQGDTSTYYYAVGPVGVGNPATLAVTGITQLSLYWGSVDSFNKMTFNFADGSTQDIVGSQIDGADGDAVRNAHEVTFSLTTAEAAALKSITFSSTTNAFEFDNVVFGTAAVPEPATYGIMTLGLGLVGAVLRRRRQLGQAVSFA